MLQEEQVEKFGFCREYQNIVEKRVDEKEYSLGQKVHQF